MADAVPDLGRVNRRLIELELQARRAAGLHGLYAATGLLVGLLLPAAEVRFNQADLPERYSVIGLVFSLNSDYEVDHPTLIRIAAAVLALTALVAIVAFLVAARAQDRTAATVALTASALLPVVLLMANFVFEVIDIESGSNDDPLEGWGPACWVLLLGGLVSCWIGALLRNQFDD